MDVTYRFSGFSVDAVRRLLLGADGRPIALKPRVFDTLLCLIEHRGELLEKQTLLDAIWPHVVVEENNLNQAISTLRRVFGESRDEHRFIVTEPGRGYRFVARVETVTTEPSDAAAGAAAPQQVGAATGPSAARAAAPTGAQAHARRPAAPYVLVAVVALFLATAAFLALDWNATPSALGPVVRVSPVTTFPRDEYSPALSPDGSRIAFSWEGDDGNRDVYVTMIDGTGLQRLTRAPEAEGDPAWSPDGRRIAFLRRVTAVQRDVFVVPALGGTEERVHSIYLRTIPDVNLAAPKLAWTDDGERLVFASGRDGREGTHIHVLALKTGELTQLTRGEPVYDNSAALSPDGEWLAFRRDPSNPSAIGTLLVQRLGPAFLPVGEPTAVPGTTRAAFHSPSWSADSRYLTFVAGPNIFEWELGSAAPRLVHNADGVLGGVASSTAEVSRLTLARGSTPPIGVAARIATGPDIFRLSLDPQTRMAIGQPEVRYFSSVGEVQPRYSPDGRRVAFVSRRSGTVQLWIAEVDGSNPREITNVDADAVVFPNWSRDGQRLVFYTSGTDGFQIYLVDAAGGPPKHVATGGGTSWSADGQHLYVTEPGAPPALARVAISDGRREPLFTGHIAFESADGRHLLYWKGQETHVYRRSLEGNVFENPEERLVETIVGGIAPVDGGFFYVAVTRENVPRAFAFYEYASRTSHDVGPAPAGTMAVGGLTVSPDGTELLYAAQVSESGADLVLLEFQPSRFESF